MSIWPHFIFTRTFTLFQSGGQIMPTTLQFVPTSSENVPPGLGSLYELNTEIVGMGEFVICILCITAFCREENDIQRWNCNDKVGFIIHFQRFKSQSFLKKIVFNFSYRFYKNKLSAYYLFNLEPVITTLVDFAVNVVPLHCTFLRRVVKSSIIFLWVLLWIWSILNKNTFYWSKITFDSLLSFNIERLCRCVIAHF